MLAVVAVAYAQVLVPTSVSHQSGIVRNIPTTLVGVPVGINDRDRSAIVSQWQIDQLIQDRLSNNQNRHLQDQIRDQISRNIQDQLSRNLQEQINRNIQDQVNRNIHEQIAIQSQQRRWNDQSRNDQILRNVDNIRTEQIRDELDRSTDTTRRLVTDDIVRNADKWRNEKLRDELDRVENTRRLTTGTTGLTTAELRSAVSGRLIWSVAAPADPNQWKWNTRNQIDSESLFIFTGKCENFNLENKI